MSLNFFNGNKIVAEHDNGSQAATKQRGQNQIVGRT